MNIKLRGIAVLVLVLLCGAPLTVYASAAEVEPNAKIQSVTVYADRAMLRKEASFTARRGETIARLTGITPHLVDESVQVSLTGNAGVRISDVKVEKTHLQKTNREKVQKLQAALEALNEQIKARSNEIAVINSAGDFLKRVTPFSTTQKASSADVEGHARFLEKALAGNYERTAKIENGLKKLQEEKKSVDNEIKALNGTQDASKSIVVYLQSSEEVRDVTLAVSYIATKAGWSPHYDMRADSTAAKVDVNWFAVIRQSTGEDWKDAQVEISTAKPFVYGNPPELEPWQVDLYQPRPVKYKAQRMEVMPMAAAAPKREAAQEKVFEEPRVEADATSFSFVLPRKIDVPSDNQPHRVLIAASGKEAKFTYYAAPKLSSYAYLRAGFQNPFPFPLLTGAINVFLDGKLVSASSLDKTVLPTEEFALPLGIDEGVKVERKQQKKFTDYAGVFSKETKVRYEYAIAITNSKNREVALDLGDQFPVSGNEQIKVIRESPKEGEAKIAEDGIITWNLKLGPGEKKSLQVAFRVEYPKDIQITGME